MKVNNIALAVVAVLLIAPLVAALVPSEEAVLAASAYLRQGEEASIVSQPYLVDARLYFVVYFHPQTNPKGKNLVVVVDAETGALVEDQRVLSKVYLFDSKATFLQNFVSENKLSFTELKTSFENGKNAREQGEASLDEVENNLARVDESITGVKTSFAEFINSAEALNGEIDGGLDADDLFNREYSNTALEGLILRYNSTLKTLATMVKNGETYQRVVVNTSNQLTQKGVIDQNSFKPGLQAAYDVGLDEFPSFASLQGAGQEFNGINSPQVQAQVNDSVQSYLFRKEKVDSNNAVEEVRPSVESILQRKVEVVECTPVANLEKAWQAALQSQTNNKFVQVHGNVTLVQSELDKVSRELSKCSASNNNNNGESQQKDNSNLYIAVVLLLIVGYFVWKFMQKKPPEGSAEQSTALSKGNLFGQ